MALSHVATALLLVSTVASAADLPDAGPSDAGTEDAGVAGAGLADAGQTDAGFIDAGQVDAGAIDAGLIDVGLADAGEPDAGGIDAGAVAPPSAPVVVPPVPVALPKIPFPPGATSTKDVVDVKVKLDISETGDVKGAEILSGAGEPFDSAVLQGVRQFKFKPALVDGKPTEVFVPFTQHFSVPVRVRAPPAAAGPRRDCVLMGLIQERGTRVYVEGMDVVARVAGADYAAVTDAHGRFRLELPSGTAEVRAGDSEHRPFLQYEVMAPNQEVKVRYLVDRLRNDRHETVIETERERNEISRTTLSGSEITNVPGTFGDPFRVVTLLPGVSTIMSLLPYPIVRGSSPGDTGELLDGVPLQLLFHLLAGPSIIPPEFIERVDFFPGNFPVQYGGYVGGIVDGITKGPSPEPITELELSLLETGGLIRRTIDVLGGITVTAGARYGFPGLLLSVFSSQISLSYWDYQARIDGHLFGGNWYIFSYGARDNLATEQTNAAGQTSLQTLEMLETNHIDMRWQKGNEDHSRSVRLILMDDESQIGADSDTRTLSLWPQLRAKQRLAPSLVLDLGLDGQINGVNTTRSATDSAALAAYASALEDSGIVTGGGAFVQLAWRPIPKLAIIPGVRTDVLHDSSDTRWSADPRLMLRYELSDAEFGGTTLKAGTGWFHQPPQLALPVPGADQAKLSFPLLASEQTSVGADVKLGRGVDVDVETYYNAMNPVLFDLSINESLAQVLNTPPTTQPQMQPTPPSGVTAATTDITRMFNSSQGRAYGLEIMLRKHDANGVFGWIAYTLSRSERLTDGSWTLFDFDRTHILNGVIGLKLPRNWELGLRLLVESGTPVTTIYGYNTGRTDPEFMVDVRVDKRAVWNKWMLDFYVDIINSTVSADSGGLIGSASFRYVLPTIGIRAIL